MKRLLLLVVAVGIVAYLVKSQGLLSPAAPAGGTASPIDKARAAAAASDARTSAAAAVSREADPAPAGVTENMTPDQVRALIGPPDDVQTDTTGSGAARETWTYRSVGKTVVFENGVVTAIH